MNGIVIVDKPQDWTSQDVTARLRRVFGTRRIGHGGIAIEPLVYQGERRFPVLVGPEGEKVEDLDPGTYLHWGSHGSLRAAMVDGGIEKNAQGFAEGGGTCARKTGADDLKLSPWFGSRGLVAHGVDWVK